MEIIILSIVLIAIVYLLILLKSKYEYWEKRKVPFPPPHYLFGNMGKTVLLRKSLHQICNDMYTEYDDCPFIGFYNFWSPAIVVRDLELIKKVLIQNFNNFYDHFVTVPHDVDPILALNPVCLKGQAWKTTRTLLTPQFTSAKLKLSIPILQKVSQDLTKYINQQILINKSCSMDAKDLADRFTAESVLTSAYGFEGNSFTNVAPFTLKVGDKMSSSGFMIKIKQLIGTFFPLLRKLFKVTFVGSPIPKYFRDVILETINYRELNSVNRADYLDYLWKQRSTRPDFTDDDLVGHAFTYYMNGTDTASIALTYTLYALALNPGVQEKCRREVKQILNKYDNDLTNEALSELEYLTRVIFETLRLYSPVGILGRSCTQDFSVSYNRHDEENSILIEKGTLVIIPAAGIHHDPRYYPDPHVFDPERFTDERRNQRPSGCFFAFGDGPRICLGKNFSMLQIKISTAAILTEFIIKRNEKTSVPHNSDFLHFLDAPKGGLVLDFVK